MKIICTIHFSQDVIDYCDQNDINFNEMLKQLGYADIDQFRQIDQHKKVIMFIRICSYFSLSYDATLMYGKSISNNLREAIRSSPDNFITTLKLIGIDKFILKKDNKNFSFGSFHKRLALQKIANYLNTGLDKLIYAN